MKYLNEFSTLSHRVYVLRTRHKKRLISGNFAIYTVHVLEKVLLLINVFDLPMVLLKNSATEASVSFSPHVGATPGWASAWRFHTNFYKFRQNISSDISHTKYSSDLNLGEGLSHFPDSGLHLLNVFDFDLF